MLSMWIFRLSSFLLKDVKLKRPLLLFLLLLLRLLLFLHRRGRLLRLLPSVAGIRSGISSSVGIRHRAVTFTTAFSSEPVSE